MVTNIKKIFENLSHITFTIYIITLYIFETRAETLKWSQYCFILFTGCAIIYILLNGKVFIHRYFLFIGGFVFYSLLSYFWSVDQDATYIKIISLTQLFILCILAYHVFYISGRMDIFIRSLLIAGLVLCIYAVYIYSWSGFIDALLNGNIRLGAEISQENVMGMQAAITFVLCLYYAIFKGFKLFYLISIAPFLLGMASGSKKTLIIILVGVVLLLYIKTGLRKIYKFAIYILIAWLLFISIINLPIFSMMNYRIEQFFSSLSGEKVSEMSTIVREQMIKFGFSKFLDKPILGYGMGGASMLYYFSYGWKTYLHCNFVEIMVNGGIMGFALFYFMYIYIIIKLFPMIKKRNMEAIIAVIILINRLFCDIAAVSYYDKTTYIYLIMGFLLIAKHFSVKGIVFSEEQIEKTY